jgi:hypothetical protein
MESANKISELGGMGSGGGKSLNKSMDSDWKAWWNVMPSQAGASPTLHVVGNIDVGDESTGASLIFDCYQKSNPPNLVLRIIGKTIFIPRDSGDTNVTLHYTQASMPGQIGSIIVVYPDGNTTTINHISMAY